MKRGRGNNSGKNGTRWSKLVALGFVGMMLSFLALPAVAQDDAVPVAIVGAFLMVYIVFMLALYIYFSYSLMVIARKTNTENGWMAWIPIINIILMLNIAQKPIWWILLCLIPLVNIVIIVLVWMAIAERRGKPNWWGIMIIVPLVNIIVPGYLAFSD